MIRYLRVAKADLLGLQSRRFARYGDIYTFTIGNTHNIVTCDPAHRHRVLVQDAASYQNPETGLMQAGLRGLLGNGLLSSNGELWRHQRRQVQPAFDARHLRPYANTMVAYTEQHMESWQADETRDLWRDAMGLTLCIVGRVLFGQNVRSAEGEVAKAMMAFRDSFGSLAGLLPRWIPYPPRERHKLALRRMCHLMDEFIADSKSKAGSAAPCLLPPLTEGLKGDVPSLSYTRQVLCEALRLYSPAPTVAREVKQETTLGGYRMPKGAHLILSIFHAQRDPRHHSDPLAFRPERFENSQESRMTPGCYLPFGSGTRACIGKNFALMEATLILATMSQRWRFELVGKKKPVPRTSIALSPAGGLRVLPRRLSAIEA